MRRALALAACCAAFAVQAEVPVAFVADVEGNATIEGDGPLRVLAELPPGTRLLVDRAEHGGWELDRLRIAHDGSRRVILRRKIIRQRSTYLV